MYLSKGYKGIYDLYYINSLTGKRTKVLTGKISFREAARFRNEFNPDEAHSLNSTANQSIDFLKLKELLLEYCRTNYFLDQKRNLPGVFASGCIPYLSPTGMVEPVSSVIIDPRNHFNNHFSFLQSSSEHLQSDLSDLKNYFDCDYWRTSIEGSTNNEEQLVVSNSSLFTPGLIDPSIISQMGETLRDKHIWYPWIKIVFRRGFPRITIYWKKFYIWKRTYHKLNDNCLYDVDYCYKYLFKQ